MTGPLTRREFLQQAAMGTAAVWLAGCQTKPLRPKSANERLNIGVVGVAHRGGANLKAVAHENIVALCDVDEEYLALAGQKFPRAARYADFRRMLEQKDIEAVVISTADHTHAVAAVAALKSGRHVYCEKPLTHTVSEARIVAETARKKKRMTQMGTQIHAGSNYRRVVELIQSGALGPVREVHNWAASVWSGHGKLVENLPVPPQLHWDLWLGPAQKRAYSPAYVPRAWRGCWAFGGGALADMACHHMDLPFWALDLRYPLTVEAEGPPVHREFAPEWLIVRYEFAARGQLPPVKLTWHNGGPRPPHFSEGLLPKWGDGTLFIGENGMLLADYNKHVLLPENQFEGFIRPEPFIPDSIGHHQEWIVTCKTGRRTSCNFDYAGALTEAVLLGNVAYRTGKKLEWNPKRLAARNCPEARQYIQHHYRRGWSY